MLGSALVLFTTVVNAYGVRLMSRINSIGVFVELVAAVLLVVLLAVNVRRGPSALLETARHGRGPQLGLPRRVPRRRARLGLRDVRLRHGQLARRGDRATRAARRRARSSRRCVASFLLGGLILLLAILSVPDLGDERLGLASGGLQLVRAAGARRHARQGLPRCIVLAITVCALAVHAATIRLMFTMARDGTLPASAALARVSPVHRTPVVPAVVIGVLAVAILVVNIRQPQIFTVVTSIAIVLIYLAYLLVTGADAARPAARHLAAAGPPERLLARPLGPAGQRRRGLWGTAMAVNLGWPRRRSTTPSSRTTGTCSTARRSPSARSCSADWRSTAAACAAAPASCRSTSPRRRRAA